MAEDDYVDVPGDCRHMPGNEYAKRGCLLCNPKPKVQEGPPEGLRLGGTGRTDGGWVHLDCLPPGVDRRLPVIEAQFVSRCKECHQFIREGDEIVPNP